jgi:hypothetical protein
MLTVLTVFSSLVLTLMILVPAQSSRENVISMPSVRRNVCAPPQSIGERPRDPDYLSYSSLMLRLLLCGPGASCGLVAAGGTGFACTGGSLP